MAAVLNIVAQRTISILGAMALTNLFQARKLAANHLPKKDFDFRKDVSAPYLFEVGNSVWIIHAEEINAQQDA